MAAEGESVSDTRLMPPTKKGKKMTTVEPIRNKEDLRKVEAILKKQGMRNLLFFTIGTNCGLRISDILALNVGDVRGRTHIQIIEKKTGKFKKFPINSKLKLFVHIDLNLVENKSYFSTFLSIS